MNFEELKNIFNNVELSGEKLVVKQELARTITFIKENYHFDVLKRCDFPKVDIIKLDAFLLTLV